LKELGNDIKLVKSRFGVVIYRIPTEDFVLPEDKIQDINKIIKENEFAAKGYQIDDIA
jgi:hypothetical protein